MGWRDRASVRRGGGRDGGAPPLCRGQGPKALAFRALNKLYSTALALNHSGTRDTADMSEVFLHIDSVTSLALVIISLDHPFTGRV